MRQTITGGLLLIPVLLYFFWVQRYAVNVPQLDDFDAVLQSVFYIEKAPSFLDKLREICALHNEHRIAYTRFVALICSKLAGGPIDFRTLIWIGNAALLGLLGCYYAGFRQTKLPLWYFMPVPLLLFQLQFFENTYFGMEALQNLTVWMWAALACWAASTNSPLKLWALALPAAILATLTSGNGLFVFLPIAAVLAWRKQWQFLLIWFVAFAVVAGLYFQGFNQGENSTPTNAPLQLAAAFLGYIGSFIGISLGKFMPILVALTMLLGIGVATYRWLSASYRKRTAIEAPVLFWLAFFAFLLLTAAAISINRSPENVLMVTRYKIATANALILFYLLIMKALPLKMRVGWAGLFCAFALAFSGFTYVKNTPIIQHQRADLLKEAQHFQATGHLINANRIWDDALNAKMEQEWTWAIQRNLYRFPENLKEE